MRNRKDTKMTKFDKNCAVHLTKDIHYQAKLEACRQDKSLQQWVCDTIEDKLDTCYHLIKLCQKCGKWELKEGQVATLEKCMQCQEEAAVMLCMSKSY